MRKAKNGLNPRERWRTLAAVSKDDYRFTIRTHASEKSDFIVAFSPATGDSRKKLVTTVEFLDGGNEGNLRR